MASAYRRAGRESGKEAAGKYRSRIYESRQSAISQMGAMDLEQLDRKVGVIGEGLKFVQGITGVLKSRRESKQAMETLGKSAYETSKDFHETGVEWDQLGDDQQKWTPQQTYGETSIVGLLNPFKKTEEGKIGWEGFGKAKGMGEGETLLGEVKERFDVLGGGERKYDFLGDEYKESTLKAQSELLGEEGISDVFTEEAADKRWAAQTKREEGQRIQEEMDRDMLQESEDYITGGGGTTDWVLFPGEGDQTAAGGQSMYEEVGQSYFDELGADPSFKYSPQVKGVPKALKNSPGFTPQTTGRIRTKSSAHPPKKIDLGKGPSSPLSGSIF